MSWVPSPEGERPSYSFLESVSLRDGILSRVVSFEIGFRPELIKFRPDIQLNYMDKLVKNDPEVNKLDW